MLICEPANLLRPSPVLLAVDSSLAMDRSALDLWRAPHHGLLDLFGFFLNQNCVDLFDLFDLFVRRNQKIDQRIIGPVLSWAPARCLVFCVPMSVGLAPSRLRRGSMEQLPDAT